MPALPPATTAVLAPTAATNPLEPPAPEQAPAVSRTVGIQTDYRESEAQTDPYTPDYVVPEGTDPEVLALAGLRWGQGLPATAAELVKIDRLRWKKAATDALPPLTDDAAFAARRQMLEKIEAQQWDEREQDVVEVQNARLAQLQTALEAREQESEVLREDRLTKLRRDRALRLDDSLATIQRQRVQSMYHIYLLLC